jgi:hypothetical protein
LGFRQFLILSSARRPGLIAWADLAFRDIDCGPATEAMHPRHSLAIFDL